MKSQHFYDAAMARNNSQSEVLSVHNVIQCCNVLEGTFKMASSLKGALYRKKLLPVTCSPETVSKKTESELPMELTEEYVGDTDSVSSEDSFGFSLSQSTAKLPVKLTRENARQNVAAAEFARSKTVSGW